MFRSAGCEVFEIQLSRGYDEASFRDDLKVLYDKLGLQNKPMVFLFCDNHVTEEGFLELVNNMLTSGKFGRGAMYGVELEIHLAVWLCFIDIAAC